MCTYLSTKQQPPSDFYKHMNFLVIYFPIFKVRLCMYPIIGVQCYLKSPLLSKELLL